MATRWPPVPTMKTVRPGRSMACRIKAGAIYVFTRSGTTWSQQAYLKASNAEAGDSLGYAIAISQDGNTIAGGAGDEDCLTPGINPPGCDNDNRTDQSSGAVYVFVRSGS